MEGSSITLHRQDLIQTAAAYKGSMKLLPLGKRSKQKVVVGDTDGVIQVFSVKKNETVGVFKSLPLYRAITRVELGKGSGQQDKIFYSYDQTVVGVNDFVPAADRQPMEFHFAPLRELSCSLARGAF